MARTSELSKKLKETQKGVLDDISKAVKGATVGSPEALLKAAAEKHKTADIIISRKSKTGRWAYFYTAEGQPMAEINPNDFETLCAHEGGGGEYMVKVKLPEGDPLKFGPYDVLGRTLAEPRSKVEVEGAVQAQFPADIQKLAFMPPGAGTKIPAGRDKSEEASLESQRQMFEMMNKYQEELAHQTAQSGDRQIAMMTTMMQQQQMASNQLMQVLVATLNPRRDDSAQKTAQNEELRQVREELQRLRDKEHQAQIELLKQQINDNKLEAIKASSQPKDNGVDKLFGSLLTAQQAAASENTKLMLKMMEMSADRPNASDQITSILSSVIGATSTNLDLLSKAAQQGLLGGTDSPIKDALVRSMESAIDVLPGLLQGLASSRGGGQLPAHTQWQEEEYEEGDEAEAMPPVDAPVDTRRMPAYDQPAHLPEAGAMGGIQAAPIQEPPATRSTTPPPAAAPAPTQAPQYTEEQIAELTRRMLTEEDLQALMKDQALTTILAKIQNSVSAKEISARVWAHAASPNRIAARWFADPEVITLQVVNTFQIGDNNRAVEIARDMMAFKAYMQQPGADANAWPDTDYRPVKPKKAAAEEPMDGEEEEDLKTAPPAEQGKGTTEVDPVEEINEGVTISEVPDPAPAVDADGE